MGRTLKCCLCKRPAFTWPSAGGLDIAYPELKWATVDRELPLCDECTISAYYQGALFFVSDVFRLLGDQSEDLQ